MKKRVMALVMIIALLSGTVFVSGASDPAISIISPVETVYGDNLLVSVKMTAPKTIKVSVYEEKQKVGDTLVSIDPAATAKEDLSEITIISVSIMTPETFAGSGSLQFYNKQLNEITPGLYRIKVDTVDINGVAVASTSTRVAVMPKDSETKEDNTIFQSQQSGALQWVQNILKSIFGN
jgi:hypothetical protein